MLRKQDWSRMYVRAMRLFHMYAKCDNMNDLRLVFDRMEERNVFIWNVVIRAHAQIGCGAEAYRLFRQMLRECLKPHQITNTSIVNPCASAAGSLERVKEVRRHACEAEFESNVRVAMHFFTCMQSVAVHISDARLVFGRMEDCDVITWTTHRKIIPSFCTGKQANSRMFLN